MSDEKFKYNTNVKNITRSSGFRDVGMINGLTCDWKCVRLNLNEGTSDILRFSWKFNWDELKTEGINRLSGYIIVHSSESFLFYSRRIIIDLSESNQMIETDIYAFGHNEHYDALFEYSMIPHYILIEEVKEESMFMFTPSEQNDAVLVVDGKKIPVNKVFLSCHSAFFRALFSSNYKEAQMNEIPIEDISYHDFKLLLGAISPTPTFPTDNTVKKLLELADRFMMPSVIAHVEHHLLHMSKIENEKKMLMGEKYGMKKVLAKAILEMDTIEKARKWKQSPEYNNFSYETKTRVLEKFI